MNWCWKENSGDTFISSDKWMHAILHFMITIVACHFWGVWIAILISETLGILTEIIETTKWWDIFQKKFMNPIRIWLNNYFGWNLKMQGCSSCLSAKDILVNNFAMLSAIIFLFFS